MIGDFLESLLKLSGAQIWPKFWKKKLGFSGSAFAEAVWKIICAENLRAPIYTKQGPSKISDVWNLLKYGVSSEGFEK